MKKMQNYGKSVMVLHLAKMFTCCQIICECIVAFLQVALALNLNISFKIIKLLFFSLFKFLQHHIEFFVFLGKQTMPDGKVIPLPPIILASLGNDPAKETLCIYGHLDVQPAKKSDGWDTEPFVLTEVGFFKP